MSIFDETRSVERPHFFDGQELYAADLDGIVAFNQAMRWLHNQSLHQPGVGNGFAISGKRGDREVRVQPGYALDAEGREIVLLDTDVEPVPPVAAETDGGPVSFDLVVSYPSDADLEEAETRAGVCLPRGVVRLRERPVFCWVRLIRDVNGVLRPLDPKHALEIQDGLAIVLGRIEVLQCKLNADLSTAVRRSARPPRQPRLACGTERVAWERWGDSSDDDSTTAETIRGFGLKARVDTRSGGFQQAPRYVARVEGRRPLAVVVETSDPPTETRTHFLDLSAYVEDASPEGFTCYVPTFALERILPSDDLITDEADRSWQITWFGIED
jgi:hypothetical protein